MSTAREQAHDETLRRLTSLLTPERTIWLESLLLPDPPTGRTPLGGLRQEAVSHAASQMLATLQKLAVLHEAGVHQWDRTSLNPHRATWLAQRGWKSTHQALQRLPAARRSPILIAFLHQALVHHTDVAVELSDQCLWACYSEAKRELADFRQAMARSTNETLTLCRALGQVLLDPAVEDPDVRTVSFARVPEALLRAAVEDTQGLLRPRPDDAIDFFGKRYSSIRPCAPSLLQTLTCRAQGPDETVLRAVEVLRDRDQTPTRQPIPRDAPMGVVTDAWRPYIREPDGSLSRRYDALGTLWHVRSALRSGAVWIEQSRRSADPDTSLMPPTEWPSRRPEVIRHTGTPREGRPRLEERAAALALCHDPG